jgi:F-type H+-transporting ATPase subunit a
VLLHLASSDNWIAHHLMGLEGILGLEAYGITKHVLAIFVVVAALFLIFIPFGRKVSSEVAPRGAFVNFIEVILLFLRDEVARPVLGKEGDKFLPVIWTFFFFILFCNLIGLFPIPFPLPITDQAGGWDWHLWGLVTPTGQIAVTGTLAAIAFFWYHGLGIKEQGIVAYIRHIVPGGVPGPIKPMMFFLESLGHIIKPAALMIRLWANMTGGHAILYATIGFIFLFGWALVVPSVGVGVAIYLLEIFVAFLQAFVFTFLVTVFLGGALHPH